MQCRVAENRALTRAIHRIRSMDRNLHDRIGVPSPPGEVRFDGHPGGQTRVEWRRLGAGADGRPDRDDEAWSTSSPCTRKVRHHPPRTAAGAAVHDYASALAGIQAALPSSVPHRPHGRSAPASPPVAPLAEPMLPRSTPGPGWGSAWLCGEPAVCVLSASAVARWRPRCLPRQTHPALAAVTIGPRWRSRPSAVASGHRPPSPEIHTRPRMIRSWRVSAPPWAR